MRRRGLRLALFLVVVVGLVGVGWLVQSNLRSQRGKSVDASALEGMLPDAVLWMQNFHRVEIRDGKKTWELEADEAQVLQDKGQVLVRKPRTLLYLKDGEQVTVSGEEGQIEFAGNDLQTVTLRDNVEIHVRDYVIRARSAVYRRDEDRIVADGPVTIVGDVIQVAGNDMVVFMKESRFELSKPVRVTVLPDQQAAKRPS